MQPEVPIATAVVNLINRDNANLLGPREEQNKRYRMEKLGILPDYPTYNGFGDILCCLWTIVGELYLSGRSMLPQPWE